MKNQKEKDILRREALMEELGNVHFSKSPFTPLLATAFETSDEDKKAIVAKHFRAIMETLGLDLSDDSLNGTPDRVAKMMVSEIFNGLNPANEPAISVFENNFGYHDILLEKNIDVFSTCEHHFLPIVGKAHVAYIPGDKVIGLSKLNRVVEHFSKRPQVQERLNRQIVERLKEVLETEDVACIIEADHYCVKSRGVGHTNSATTTLEYSGVFKSQDKRKELLDLIQLKG